MEQQNWKMAVLTAWGWEQSKLGCFQGGDDTPTISGWYPLSWHCQQVQNVDLLE